MPCPVSHIEWRVTDLERGAAFLSALFGWRFAVYSPHYRLYTPAAGPCVGLMEVPEVEPCPAACAYIQVDDIDHRLQQAEQLGGRVVTARTAVPDYGWYAQILDPDGNAIGLFEPWSPDRTAH
jgi:predicted enzyme related to lactoylglutathione lyase